MVGTSMFVPEHRSLDAMLVEGASYQIPAYQRPYVWDCRGKTDRDSQINRLWEDLWTFFSTDTTNSREYFLGSVVVIDRQRLHFEVVDGQQRLTSLLLLLAGMSCFLKALSGEPSRIDNALGDFVRKAADRIDDRLYNQVGVALVREPKVKVQRNAAQPHYDLALAQAVACADKSSRTPEARHKEVIERYFRNRDFFLDQMRKEFLTDNHFGQADAAKFNDFYFFLLQRVSMVQIRTSSEETANTVFEILNNRGMPLSSLDLLRNFVIQELNASTPNDASDHERRWEDLEKNGADVDYLARWVESRQARALSSSAFNEARALARELGGVPGTPPIEVFLRQLEDDLVWYGPVRHPEQTVEDPVLAARILFLLHAGNARYLTNLLLALFRQVQFAGPRPGDDRETQLHQVLAASQRYLTSVLLGQVRFSNAVIFKAIHYLKEPEAALRWLDQAHEHERIAELLNRPIHDNRTATLLVSTIVRLQEAEAASGRDAVGSFRLNPKAVSLEHILPEQPAESSTWVVHFTPEERSHWTNCLGNFTLLTQAANSSARNSDFEKKVLRYRRATLPMTRDLATFPRFGPTELRARHEQMVGFLVRHLQPKLGK